MRVWIAGKPKELRHHTDFDAIVFSANSKTMPSGDENGHALFALAPHFAGGQPIVPVDYPILAFAPSPDGRRFAIASTTGVQTVDTHSHQLRTLHTDRAAGFVAYASHGTKFIVVDEARCGPTICHTTKPASAAGSNRSPASCRHSDQLRFSKCTMSISTVAANNTARSCGS